MLTYNQVRDFVAHLNTLEPGYYGVYLNPNKDALSYKRDPEDPKERKARQDEFRGAHSWIRVPIAEGTFDDRIEKLIDSLESPLVADDDWFENGSPAGKLVSDTKARLAARAKRRREERQASKPKWSR